MLCAKKKLARDLALAFLNILVILMSVANLNAFRTLTVTEQNPVSIKNAEILA